MKLKKLFRLCDKYELISVLDLSNNIRCSTCTVTDFIIKYEKEVLERKISHIKVDAGVLLIDIF